MECVRSSRSLFYLRLREPATTSFCPPHPSPPPSAPFPHPLPRSVLDPTQDDSPLRSVHEARLGRRGITYRHWRSWGVLNCCCAICTRTVRNLKILIVTGARVAQYRVTHAWPNWIVMDKTGVKKQLFPMSRYIFLNLKLF